MLRAGATHGQPPGEPNRGRDDEAGVEREQCALAIEAIDPERGDENCTVASVSSTTVRAVRERDAKAARASEGE
jgi:hypothetical protein